MPAPFISNARAISSTRIRIDFSAPINDSSVLRDQFSYTITTVTTGAIVPAIQEVFVPGTGPTRTIDLITAEMTDGASYEVNVNNNNVIGEGGAVTQTPFAFAGIGIAPSVVVVVATSPTTVEIRFSEPIKDFGNVREPTAYIFDNGLIAVDVLELTSNIVIVETSQQTAGILYSLQLVGDWFDHANNFVSTPPPVPMLGFVSLEAPEPILQLNIYNFIIKVIRDEDQTNGRKFLERFLKGPQAAWQATNEIILGIPKLWSVVDIPDEFLPLLKNIVGWTRGYDTFTHRLEPNVLRRLIQDSVEFWSNRGPEDAIEDILNLTTAAKLRIFTYFDWRWITGESHFGEEHDGFDPWAISELPEGSNVYQVRIVDNGELDHDLVKEIVRITRPIGERVEIIYLAFYDRFLVDNDKSQWTDEAGVSQVLDGVMRLPNLVSTEDAFVSVLDSTEWNQYVVTWRVLGNGSYDLIFYRTSDDDQYILRVTTAPGGANGFGKIELRRRLLGTETLLTSLDMTSDTILYDDIYYTFRVEVFDLGVTNEIKIIIDADLFIVATDSSHSAGSVGIRRIGSAGVMDLDECEIFKLPVISDFVDINT